MLARLRVILTAAVTYFVAAAAIASVAAGELGAVAGIPTWVMHALGVVVAVSTGAIGIIRRVTPALPETRGLLPPPPAGSISRLDALAIHPAAGVEPGVAGD